MSLLRVGAVVLDNKKILLVTGHSKGVFWTPGGRVENAESPEQALKRELLEELSVEMISSSHYLDYVTLDEFTRKEMKVSCFFADYRGVLLPNSEITDFRWCSKEDLTSGNLRVTRGIQTYLIPRLISENRL